MSTITAILEADADGTLHLPLPELWKRGKYKVEARIDPVEPAVASDEEQSSGLLEIMERIARRNPFRDIPDPVAWQQEMREDVTLPFRE